MITSVHFENCGPLRDATLPLEPFTLIIGPNGSGKTTALRSIVGRGSGAVLSLGIGDRPRSAVRYESDAGAVLEYSSAGSGLRSLGSVPPANALDDAVKAAKYYAIDPRRAAAPARLTPNAELDETGFPLAVVLDRLRDKHEDRFDALNREIHRCLPEFCRILFDTPSEGMRAISLRTNEGSFEVPVADLADGAKLALVLLTIAYLPQPPPLICLEEPDRGLHPRLLRDVKSALRRLAFPAEYDEQREPVQVIASTHNPFFLDLFRDELEQVVIASKHGLEATFRRAADIPNIDLILRDSMLSNAWYTGVLGGVPEPACALPS